MRASAVAVVVCCVALRAAAEVRVQQQDGRLSVEAKGAPLAEVLDRLARQTGMQVVYEGAPPRSPVTVTIANRTPAEAVVSLLEGLGLNYALRLDESGGRVMTLVMAGAGAGKAGAGAAAAGRDAKPETPHMPPPYPPPPSYPQDTPVDEEYPDSNGVIPPPPPQPPQEFTITPPQKPEPEVEPPPFSPPSLGSGFSSPFGGSGGFSNPAIIGSRPIPGQAPPSPPPPPEQDEKDR